MSDDDNDTLREYRDELIRNKEHLEYGGKLLEKSLTKETDEWKRVLLQTLSEILYGIRYTLNQIEWNTILIAGLKSQIELQGRILLQLPQIKDNVEVFDEVKRAFEELKELYKQELESFMRHRDDFEFSFSSSSSSSNKQT